jgi:DNA-binding phage protein
MDRGVMKMKDRSHDEAMTELFRDGPATAAVTLDTVLAGGDQGELLVTLRQLPEAFGGIEGVAKAADLKTDLAFRPIT